MNLEPNDAAMNEPVPAPAPAPPQQPVQPQAQQPVQPQPVQPQPVQSQPVHAQQVQPVQPQFQQQVQPQQVPVAAQVGPVDPNAGFGAAFSLIPKIVKDMWAGNPGAAFERAKNNTFLPWVVIGFLSLAISLWLISAGSMLGDLLSSLSRSFRAAGLAGAASYTDDAFGRLIYFIFTSTIIFALTLMGGFSIRALFMKAVAGTRGARGISFKTAMSRIGVALVPLTLVALPLNLIAAMIGPKSISIGFLLLPVFAALILFTEVMIYLGTASLLRTPKSILVPYFAYWTLFVYISGLLVLVSAVINISLQ